jgi:SAM-dependent methyltransferase
VNYKTVENLSKQEIIKTSSDIFIREIEFHDTWADSTATEDILVSESFESPLALENGLALKLMGDLNGKKLLDVGTGLGEAAVYFALQGAQVIATDISPGMVERARLLAEHHHTHIETVVCPAEKLDLPDNLVDICYAANVLHHVSNRQATLQEIHRVLKPNGLIVTWDPLAYNPIINVYRWMADKVRTEDEEPLNFDIIREYQTVFEQVEHHEFWLSGLLIFIKYYLIDRLHPNQDRYWKRILKEDASTLTWLKPLLALDRYLLRLPLLNYMAWTILVSARKGDKTFQV